jgi:hypothetical protein
MTQYYVRIQKKQGLGFFCSDWRKDYVTTSEAIAYRFDTFRNAVKHAAINNGYVQQATKEA